MSQKKILKKRSAFFAYVLGRRPDEFGLVPDNDGYVKIRDFLKATTEEEGWRFLRQSHINELLMWPDSSSIEVNGNLIRCVDRKKLPRPVLSEVSPKLLFFCVRQRAYPNIFGKEIRATGIQHLILSSDRVMAERLGKRTDNSPIVLTIQAHEAEQKGVVFFSYGESLYLAEFIPAGCYSGPALPKEKPEMKKTAPPPKPEPQPEPGSFIVDFLPDPDEKKQRNQRRRKKAAERDKSRKQMRKQKRRMGKDE